MDHRPFEDWLLENKKLNTDEKRQLNAHLRSCQTCSALAEVDLALKSVRLAEPSAGFTDRFQVRLEARKKALRQRNFWGFFVLTVSVVGLLAWACWPFIQSIVQSPVSMLASWLSSVVSIWASAEALFQGGRVILKVVPGFVPTYVWMILLLIAGGWSLLWVFSLMKLTKIPQGA
ncbi:MAG TPA: hypothetical protein VMC09_09850 [Anaerolineales bacterium]|nr:hypothetical protein [Anaerolineales bacterium]